MESDEVFEVDKEVYERLKLQNGQPEKLISSATLSMPAEPMGGRCIQGRREI